MKQQDIHIFIKKCQFLSHHSRITSRSIMPFNIKDVLKLLENHWKDLCDLSIGNDLLDKIQKDKQ